MSSEHTHRDHEAESRVIPRDFRQTVPSQGSAPHDAEASGISRRRVVDEHVRVALDRLKGADRALIPLVEELMTTANRECAARRVQLRQAEAEVRRLRVLALAAGADPREVGRG